MTTMAMVRTLGLMMVCALLLFSALPVNAAVHSSVGQGLMSLMDGGSFSGDDAYDPAAGGLVLPRRVPVSSYSGDDAYDPAAVGWEIPQRAFTMTFSGDDAYDPATSGLNPLTVPQYAATNRISTQQDD